MKTPRSKSLFRLGKSLFFLLWVILFVGTWIEFAARKRFEPVRLTVNFSSEFEWDREIGWRGRRGFNGTLHHGKVPNIPVSINRDGFRDDDWDEKLSNAHRRKAQRILFLGDSTGYGWGEPKEDRLSERLEAEFDRNGESVAIFNATIPGFGPSQQLRLLPELLDRIKPDKVLLLLCGNDYGDAALPYDHRYPFRVYKPFYNEAGDLVLNASVPRRPSLAVRGTPLEELRLFYFADEVTYRIEDRIYRRYSIPRAEETDLVQFDSFMYDDELNRRYPHVEKTVIALYDRMRRLTEASKARFFLISTDEGFEERLFPKLPPQMELIHYVDLSHLAPESVQIPLDGHPNRLWSDLYAKAVYSALAGSRRSTFAMNGELR